MATLLSPADFINELLIPGASNDRSGECSELCAMIEKYEPLFLSAAMGYSFYKDMMDSIQPDGVTTDEYKALIDGVDFMWNGKLTKWNGLREYTAQYVYYWYWRNAMTSTTGIGQTIANAENASITTPAFKMTRMFNEAIKIGYILWPFLNINSEFYPAYISSDVDVCFFTPVNPYGL